MKKLIAIIVVMLMGALLVSCNLLDLFAPTPDPKPDPEPEPIIKGESAIIFGANSGYTVVYPSGDSTYQSLADKIVSAVDSLRLKKPATSLDSDKKETKCELLIGETDRALSAEAKQTLSEVIEEAPNDYHWIWLYRDGQLALYANTEKAYEHAIEELTEKYYKAGEIAVNIKTSDIGYAKAPHETYMSYEIPDNFYEGYTDPFDMKDSDYKKMKLTFANDTTYTIEYADDIGGTWKAAFVRKNWGCWMMGYIMYKSPKGKTSTIQTTGTDFEFVLSCAGKDIMTFRGGNHGDYPKVYGGDWVWDAEDSAKSNDRLLDLTFYDGKSGEKVELAKGASVMLDGVRIVIHNNIYELEYTQENVLVNVEKSYLYNGYDILCDSKLYMTQDVRFGHGTKSAMLPIQKDYSNNVLLYNMDGTVDYVKTLPAGQSVNTSLTGFKATKAELWGDANPELHMSVEILNPDDQFLNCNEEGYLQVRDMGERFNKIYFAPFNEGATMKHGSELNYKTKWTFSYEPDFVAPDREPDIFIQ